MRLRNNAKANSYLMSSKIVINKFPFKIKKNTIIEMGMGKGEMITTMANQNSHIWYIGIEKYPTVAMQAVKKAQELNLKNLLIIVQDINKLNELLTGKTKIIWLTFPDPWPKIRHCKRRLTHLSFLNLYKKILAKDGIIKLKTDNNDFFEYSFKSFNNDGWELKNITKNLHKEKFAKNNIQTGYEIKWSSKGKTINYLEASRK